jgi:hypothetical protein
VEPGAGQESSSQGVIPPSTNDQPGTLVEARMQPFSVSLPIVAFAPEPVRMYFVREEQLDAVSSEEFTFFVGVATFLLGTAITAILSLVSLDDPSAVQTGTFVGTAVATGVGAFVLGSLAWARWKARHSTLARIKAGQPLAPGSH